MKYFKQTQAIIAVALLVFAGSARAQNNDLKPFRFGFRVAPSVNWIKVDSKNIDKGKSGFGLTYGVMGDFNFGNNYAFSTGIYITNLKSSVRVDQVNGISNVDLQYNVRYLEIPLALKLRTNEIGYIRYYGSFGLTPGFLIRSRGTYDPRVLGTGTPDENDDIEVNGKKNDFNTGNSSINEDNVNLVRVPLTLEAGLEYTLSGQTALTAGVRFDNGFTKLMTADNTNTYSKYLSLCVGVFF